MGTICRKMYIYTESYTQCVPRQGTFFRSAASVPYLQQVKVSSISRWTAWKDSSSHQCQRNKFSLVFFLKATGSRPCLFATVCGRFGLQRNLCCQHMRSPRATLHIYGTGKCCISRIRESIDSHPKSIRDRIGVSQHMWLGSSPVRSP
jgi:hypothetical protein